LSSREIAEINWVGIKSESYTPGKVGKMSCII
jgi:hypothetical protein